MAKAKARTKTKVKAKKTKAKATKKSVKKKTAKKVVKAKAKKIAKKPTTRTTKTTKRASVKRTTASQTKTMTAPQIPTVSLNVGDIAPDFSLQNQNGEIVTLSQFRGRNVVLYFYPKDDTPGCTKEACSFRDNLGALEAHNTTILGVSFDDQDAHQKFIAKYSLNFQLLSDLDKETAKAYGVFVQKNMYGNISWGIERTTFIIDKDGRISRIFRKVQVDGHTDQVIEALRSLAA